MKRVSRLPMLFGMMVMAGLITGCMLRADDDPSSLVGKAAPDFTLKTLGGKEVKLSSQKGSVTVLDFWATWCPPCQKALPHLQSLAADEKLAKRGLKVISVNTGENGTAAEKEAVAKEFINKNSFTFTVALDLNSDASKAYFIESIPVQVVIGRDGIVKQVLSGFKGKESEEALDKAVEAALSEEKK